MDPSAIFQASPIQSFCFRVPSNELWPTLERMMFALQDLYAPESICFGCGPKNPNGLHVKSVVDGDRVIAHWQPHEEHHAFPNVLCGGIIGAIMDCHSNWTAAWALRTSVDPDKLPCTVTAEFHVKLLKPTPMDRVLTLIAHSDVVDGKTAQITTQLTLDDTIYATCEGQFVSVSDGHPGFHRW